MTQDNDIAITLPKWVVEVHKEIKRLDKKIVAMHKKLEKESINEIDAWEDINNWTGWRDGLSWCLKMREGKATRKDAWGKK